MSRHTNKSRPVRQEKISFIKGSKTINLFVDEDVTAEQLQDALNAKYKENGIDGRFKVTDNAHLKRPVNCDMV